MIGLQDELKNNFAVCITENAEIEMSKIIQRVKLERNKKVKRMIEKYPKKWDSLGSEIEVDAFTPKSMRKMVKIHIQNLENKK